MTRRKSTPPSKPLPPALSRNDARTKAAARATALVRAREDVSLIVERKHVIAESFYDIGEALLRLREPSALKALGCATFGDLCDDVLDLSRTTAETLIGVVTRVRRSEARDWGQEKSVAIVQLAKAVDPKSGGAVDVRQLTRLLPRGTTMQSASAHLLKKLALQRRHANQSTAPKGRPRGRTTSPEERALAEAITHEAHRKGFATVKVEPRATRPGHPSTLAMTGVPCDRAAELFAVIASIAKKTGRRVHDRS